MFTDASVACDGPSVDGPGLSTWAAGVLDGSIRDVPALEPHLLDATPLADTRVLSHPATAEQVP